MTWVAEPSSYAHEEVLGLLQRHKLLPENIMAAAATCSALAKADYCFDILNPEEGDKLVARMFITGVLDGDTASIDMIPDPKFFRSGFDEPFKEAMAPVLSELFNERELRRITAVFPSSRSRTKRALSSLGFEPEGKLRDGVNLHRTGVEDLRVFALLSRNFKKEH